MNITLHIIHAVFTLNSTFKLTTQHNVISGQAESLKYAVNGKNDVRCGAQNECERKNNSYCGPHCTLSFNCQQSTTMIHSIGMEPILTNDEITGTDWLLQTSGGCNSESLNYAVNEKNDVK